MQRKVHVNTREAELKAAFLAARSKRLLLSTVEWLWEFEEHQIALFIVVVFNLNHAG